MGEKMCLAIPGKVIKVEKEFAIVDYSGEQRKANIELVDIKPGDFVIVQAQFVVQKIPKKEAVEAIKLWQENIKK